MSWPDDLYRGIPIRRNETWTDCLRRKDDERRWADAQGTPTRQRQDRNGLGPKDGGPVHESGCAQDAPKGTHHG